MSNFALVQAVGVHRHNIRYSSSALHFGHTARKVGGRDSRSTDRPNAIGALQALHATPGPDDPRWWALDVWHGLILCPETLCFDGGIGHHHDIAHFPEPRFDASGHRGAALH